MCSLALGTRRPGSALLLPPSAGANHHSSVCVFNSYVGVYSYSYCCHNKLPQTWWLKTTQIHFLVVLSKPHWAKIKVMAGSPSFWFSCLFERPFELREAAQIPTRCRLSLRERPGTGHHCPQYHPGVWAGPRLRNHFRRRDESQCLRIRVT